MISLHSGALPVHCLRYNENDHHGENENDVEEEKKNNRIGYDDEEGKENPAARPLPGNAMRRMMLNMMKIILLMRTMR